MPPSISEKRAAFRALHRSGCFVLPNPWDIGSALFLQHLGFKALASTSSGLAWSTGHADNALPRDAVLAHLRELVRATSLPVNADFENGFGATPGEVAENVALAVETGVAGLSIEDSTGDPAAPLLPIETAAHRIAAARQAIDAAGGETLLVGRAENFFAGSPDLDDAIARLRAYAEAGADCLYAPGIQTAQQVRAVVQAVAPRPVNLLLGAPGGLSIDEAARLGVRRVSVGGALARAAWGGFMRAARGLAEGRLEGFAQAAAGSELNALFGRNAAPPPR
ncbi:isocitrate lyase/phosphoenolpyruvate mutase family protein [Achromobacter sp. Marseille-Q4962]|uniref:isocitrate lyase/PEP mutase family protein n=1 Tax=Achromobacter sp. Marseille-Q4962 TaxID=2942202 RepID=UPI002073AE56|nr:isocitrate lyase/phosphoenolpyruvate mutase family protein [Achromobacter sp. Marseille-Q4962]